MATKKNVTVDNATKATVSKETKAPAKTASKTTAKRDTKESLTQYLNDNIGVIKTDKDLSERVAYVAKMWKKDQSKVDITTLRSLKKETEQLVLQAQAAASLKKSEDTEEAKPKKSLKRKVAPKTTEAEPVQQTEEDAKPAKGKKQSAPKSEDSAEEETKAEPKKSKKSKVVESHVEGREVIVDRFADEYQTEIGTFTKAADIQSYKDLAKAVSEGRDVYLMFYIDKRVARTIDYVGGLTLRSLDELSKSWFENDLDISRVVFISEGEETIVISVSEYTDAPFIVNKDEIAYDKKDGVRYSGRLTYEIYELTEEAEAE